MGANIRRARNAAHLTQHDLAVAVDMSDAMAVSRWERGLHKPSDEKLLRIADVLGRDIAWFYSEQEVAA